MANPVQAQSQILLVEDDPYIAESLAELLLGEGYAVVSAQNGKEALDYLRSSQSLPRLILLDLMMPVMDGYRFREAQKQDARLADIPVVAMSADRGAQLKTQGTGVRYSLRKPLELDELLRIVSEVCSGS
jgi:CheY-like chemotaxis protein